METLTLRAKSADSHRSEQFAFMGSDWLHTKDKGPMRWLTIDRPERKNAIPHDGWEVLAAAFDEFEWSNQRVLIVSGADGDFCAGADFDPNRMNRLQSTEARNRRMKAVASAALALHAISKPTIAAVDGVAVGAGMNLALGCDVVVATDRGRFAEIFVRRGLSVDFGGSWLLPRIVGLQRAKELILSGRMVGAAEALTIGLVTEIMPVGDLEERVTAIATRFLVGAPVAQMLSKRILNSSYQVGLTDALLAEGEAQADALSTDVAMEGLLAFLEKRDPGWTGT